MFCDCTYEDEFENDNIFREWKRNIDKIMREHPNTKLVVIECGAGITVSKYTFLLFSSLRHRNLHALGITLSPRIPILISKGYQKIRFRTKRLVR